MLVIDKKTKTYEYIVPKDNKYEEDKKDKKILTTPDIIINKCNCKNKDLTELINLFDNLLENTSFDTDKYSLFINTQKIKEDFKKLICNKSN